MAATIGKASELVKTVIVNAKPLLAVMKYYAKVELVPPTVSDIPAIRNGITKLLNSARTGRYREVTVREAWLNTLVTAEVLCWFYVGECIGKRHIVGYDV